LKGGGSWKLGELKGEATEEEEECNLSRRAKTRRTDSHRYACMQHVKVCIHV